jgi:ElaB/YqjD/DUF883 family membrane-anchored ribosome-binding protein
MDERTDQIIAERWGESGATSGSTEDFDSNTEQLRADIEDTRAEMTQTINEIQERLSPEHLVGQVKETVRDATIGKVERVMEKVGDTISEVAEPAREVAGRAGTAIKEAGTSVAGSMWRNPIPVALIGLGIGMLFMRKSRKDGYDATLRTRSTRPVNTTMGESVRMMQGTKPPNTFDTVKQTATNLTNRSTNALSNLGTKAKESASAVGTRFGEVLRVNPLAVGAVAVAAGTAVGLVLPSTNIETEYIGETSEKLIDSAEDVARGALNKVQDAARQMAPQQPKPPQPPEPSQPGT